MSTSVPTFFYGLPWDEIETVLDVGSGMGAMAPFLCDRAKIVVSVEADLQQAMFQAQRAAQDGFDNWHPIIAGATALPFPPEAFDLVIVNEDLKRLGLAESGITRLNWQRLLTHVYRLLKPKGYVYIRCFPHGNSESSVCARLLPRWLTEWRRGATSTNGATQRTTRNRGFAATPAQYELLVKDAGFDRYEVFGVQGESNRQQAVYRLDDVGERRTTQRIVDPPVTWKGLLRRRLAGLWFQHLEAEMVVLGRKSAEPGRLVWADLPHEGPVTQFTTTNKVFALCFTSGKPTSIFIAPRSEYAGTALAKEYHLLVSATEHCGPGIEDWQLRWPKPLGSLERHGLRLYHYEYVSGMPLSHLLMPVAYNPTRFHRLFVRLLHGYVDLCRRMTQALHDSLPVDCLDLLDRLAALDIDDKVLSTRIQEACLRIRRNPWPAHITHGDLSLSNTIVRPRTGMVLVDWENTAVGLVAIDLLRLLYDTWDDSRRFKPRIHQAVMARATDATRFALGCLGMGLDTYADLEALFTAHQVRLGLARDVSPEKMLRAYHDRAFALGPA